MRKRQMNFIKEMIDILERAHESTYKVLSVNSYSSDSLDAITNLLTGCQTTAINIGNLIEESEGEGFITVKYLEDYCELVYSINEELRGITGSINSEKISKKLNKMLLKIENSIKHDIPLRREAVFLPYKASMWDSLESVWEAAEADPDCDAYVIPIPYFDKNPDGSVREEHYEADLFPENVPITHYSEYDFGKHHPDMIFIHNPYDYGNLVTTIHPFFYAENMKKVTDCLVYIPYFATSGSMGADIAWCPVYDHVDYIVIQTENYRQLYSPDIPDEKFLPFGSPKFDKVIRKCQNPPKAPDEWVKRAAGKKVLFYNTSLNCMLQNTPQYLKKMQYVFDTFRRHPDYCLVWRPHPLFESTLKAMRPEYLEVYGALRNSFLNQNEWILDETPCVEDTIAFCDGYIGDMYSSIVALFGVSGKPVLILNDSINRELNEDELKTLYSKQVIETEVSEDVLRYTLINGRKLYELDKESNKYKFYCNVSEYTYPFQYMFSLQVGDEIVVFPYINQEILVVKDKQIIRKIELNKEKEGLSFLDYKIVGKYVFLIPCDYSCAVRFDSETFEITYISGVREFILNDRNNEKKFGANWKIDDTLYFLSGTGDSILKIKADTLEYESVSIKNKQLYVKAQYEKKAERVWLFPEVGTQIAILDINKNVVKYINYSESGAKAYSRDTNQYGERGVYYSFFEDGDNYILAPYWGNKFIKLDKDGKYLGDIETNIKLLAKDVQYNFTPEMCAGYVIQEGNRQIYTSYVEGKRYELINRKLVYQEQYFDNEDESKDENVFCDYRPNLRYVCVEGHENSLETMLQMNIEEKHNRDIQIEKYKTINSSPNGDCGKRVYNKLIN